MRINRIQLIVLMASRDISVEKLAEKSGLSRVTISSIRAGKTCSTDTAQKIAAALEVSLDSLTKQEVAVGEKE